MNEDRTITGVGVGTTRGEKGPRVSEPPDEVRVLAARRAAARAARDFATADTVRDEMAAAGWLVQDGRAGWTLAPAPPYKVLPAVTSLPDHSGEPDHAGATVAVLVEGWPDDVRECVGGLLAHAPANVTVFALDLGNVDGAGNVLHDVAARHPDRIREWHVAGTAGWATARTALLRADRSAVHIWIDISTVLTGDALTPLLTALADPTVVAAGWRGVDVDLANAWRSFVPAGPGEVDALLGYLLAVRRGAALRVGGPHPAARFYRNADLEFCLALRAAGLGRLVVPRGVPPVRQGRHHGYYDTDPADRDRESRRTYDRLLSRFRGQPAILRPRA